MLCYIMDELDLNFHSSIWVHLYLAANWSRNYPLKNSKTLIIDSHYLGNMLQGSGISFLTGEEIRN